MIWMLSLLAHAWGDYVLQSDWQASHKTQSSWPAFIHALLYGLCFVPVVLVARASWWVLAVVAGSHFVIDRWRLARYVCWAKNFLAPRSAWPRPWRECTATGYDPEKPAWMSVWLMIIADNTLHVTINTLALLCA